MEKELLDQSKCEVKQEPFTIFVKEEREDSYEGYIWNGHDSQCGDKSDVKIKTEASDEILEQDLEENRFSLIKSGNISDEFCGNDESKGGDQNDGAENPRKETKLEKNKFECEFCDRSFPFLSKLQRHLLGHTGEKPFVCSICEKSFKQGFQLKLHMYKHKGVLPFYCEICLKGYVNKDNLKRHMMKHAHHEEATEVTCDVKPEEGEDPLLINNQTSESNGLLKEPQGKPNNMKNITLMCNICEKVFRFASALKTHMQIHSGEKTYNCNLCGEGFNHKRLLMSHIFKHKGEEPYKCEICSKGFTSNNNIKRHMRTHTGEKPFKCQYCPNSYASRRAFRLHELKHSDLDHFESEKKQFVCDKCGATYQTRPGLVKHMLLHSKDKNDKTEGIKEEKATCTICQKQFCADNIKRHMRIHTGERPFKCKVCPKSFKQSAHLKGHEMIHAGKKPHRCKFCERTFTQSAHLRAHEIVHSGNRSKTH